MRDYLDLGCAPSHEDCAQVGSSDYYERSRRESRAYMGQLRRMFGEEPDGAGLSIRSNPHDFGTYLSVVCYFDADNQASVDYAFKCEGQAPEFWDEEAQRELATEARKPRKEMRS
jgi:hypothetical protein